MRGKLLPLTPQKDGAGTGKTFHFSVLFMSSGAQGAHFPPAVLSQAQMSAERLHPHLQEALELPRTGSPGHRNSSLPAQDHEKSLPPLTAGSPGHPSGEHTVTSASYWNVCALCLCFPATRWAA